MVNPRQSVTGSNAHAFDFLHGTWAAHHAVRRRRLEDAHEWDTYRGRAVYAPILDGAGQVDQIWLPHREEIGSTLRLYDRDADLWQLHWSTSDATRLDPPLQGRFVDGVGRFTGFDRLRGRGIDVQFVWDRIDPEHARWTQSFAWSDTGAWEPNWIMEFERISADGASATTAPLDLTCTSS